MNKVFSAHAVSVDGYISGRDPSDADGGFDRGLGDAPMLFDWYSDGDTPSQVFGFRLSEPSARVFDALAARVGAAVAGRATYEHSGHWGGDGPHPTARLFVLSHRPAPEISEKQTLITTGIEDAIAAARDAAGDKDVGLMAGGPRRRRRQGRRPHGRRRRDRGAGSGTRRRTHSSSGADPARRRQAVLSGAARARAAQPRRSRGGAGCHPPALRGGPVILVTGTALQRQETPCA